MSTGRRRWRVRRRLDLVAFWRARADLDEAATHAYTALRLAEHLPLPDLAAVAVTVANIERDRDRPDVAVGILTGTVGALERAAATLAGDRVLVAALAAVGDAQRRAGRYNAAAETLDSALQVAERLGEPGPLTTAHTFLGILAKDLGAYDEAARHYSRVLALHRTAGASAADRASMAHNLAGLAYAEGRFTEAEGHARRAVALRRRQPVEKAEDQTVLAAALAGQGRNTEAAALLEQAMRVCREAVPPRRYELAVQLHNLAAIDQASGRTTVAEARYREALALKEALLGPEHPEVALVLHNLANLLQAQGRAAEAARCTGRAFLIAVAAYPPGHPVLAAIRTGGHRP